MKIGPKYKIARRLGAQIFEKTQTQKFAAAEQKRNRGQRPRRPRTDFALQMQEKQKARFSYGITEKQFRSYVKDAIASKDTHKADKLFKNLEQRLDNVVYRAGLVPTRRAARQAVSHGHIVVNGKKITVPSHTVDKGDVITAKDSSVSKGLFAITEESSQTYTAPAWLKVEGKKKAIQIEGEPKLSETDVLFDLDSVLEFYSR